ncbi:MAG: DEAD/DEAH box helicase family protein [Tannerella sp.]|jgi:SNF2 family DNA or RNA helicase|nr:DEAD/DEAH box helicase family protein [Tannerella sp.]
MDIIPVIERVKQQLSKDELFYGDHIYNTKVCTILSQSPVSVDFIVTIEEDEDNYVECVLLSSPVVDEKGDSLYDFTPEENGERKGWTRYSYACLLTYKDELESLNQKAAEHKKYTREGMIRRVLEERRQRAEKAKYRIKWAKNIYGDHLLTNDAGVKYKVFLRDFENETGYSDSADAKYNKLGTTKHIMYVFDKLKSDRQLYDKMDKKFPFIEIYCDPLNKNQITWYYSDRKLPHREGLLINRFFGDAQFIEDDKCESFLDFIEEATEFPDTICIRPEVKEKIERRYEQLMLADLRKTYKPDFSFINVELFPYQKEGVEFALFRKAAIIADEMGLGKTVQAIATAVLKKQIFGFNKTLIVCPATLKSQWKKEIEKFTGNQALIVSGTPDSREKQYLLDSYYFFIVNYETVLRDSQAINRADFDFLILDEAQKIKNYETKTSSAINKVKAKHSLVITGTPIENRLIDIFTIVNTIDPHFFGPLWEFSYQHCLFDPHKPNKIDGYYDLDILNYKLSDILIRREKRNVLEQLPSVRQIEIPVKLSPLQADFHASYIKGVSKIIKKKFLTPYDMQRIMLLLTAARMVCDSTFLVDEETNESPKLDKLREILFEKLEIQSNECKIIIFSEWIKIHKIIADMLRHNGVGFVELNGSVPVKLRGELIKKFESNPECKIFLSTEAGGSGLNLQVADTLINFELPWNPAKKNQRTGRIDRLGQTHSKLTIYNMISINSIEQRIAVGLLIKQNLFDGVLSDESISYVDFSSKGRSQFIQQIEDFIDEKNYEADPETLEQETIANQSVLPDLEELERQEDLDYVQEDVLDYVQEDVLEKVAEDVLEEVQEDVPENAKEIVSESATHQLSPEHREPETAISQEKEKQMAEFEQVMNNGMQFLAGLFKMSTGKELGPENQKIEIDKETGEVVMRFKL